MPSVESCFECSSINFQNMIFFFFRHDNFYSLASSAYYVFSVHNLPQILLLSTSMHETSKLLRCRFSHRLSPFLDLYEILMYTFPPVRLSCQQMTPLSLQSYGDTTFASFDAMLIAINSVNGYIQKDKLVCLLESIYKLTALCKLDVSLKVYI